MKYFIKIIKESIIIVILSSLMGLLSGTLLSFNEEIGDAVIGIGIGKVWDTVRVI